MQDIQNFKRNMFGHITPPPTVNSAIISLIMYQKISMYVYGQIEVAPFVICSVK